MEWVHFCAWVPTAPAVPNKRPSLAAVPDVPCSPLRAAGQLVCPSWHRWALELAGRSKPGGPPVSPGEASQAALQCRRAKQARQPSSVAGRSKPGGPPVSPGQRARWRSSVAPAAPEDTSRLLCRSRRASRPGPVESGGRRATSFHACFSAKVRHGWQHNTRDGDGAEHSWDRQQNPPEPAAAACPCSQAST